MDGCSVPPKRAAMQEAFWTWAHGWVKKMLQELLTMVLQTQQQALVGAGWNQRSDARRGYRNGFYSRSLTTGQGLLSIKIPRCRRGAVDCSTMFNQYQRRAADVDRILLHAYISGSSTRATAELSEQVFGGSLSHQTVSTISRWLDEQLSTWRSRPIEPVYRAVFIDGMHVNTIEGDRQVMLVTGMTYDGRHEVLGFSVGTGERCRHLLWDLRNRGLEGVELFVSDESGPIRSAIAEVFPETSWQHCTFHRMQALWRDIGQKDYRWEMVKDASNIFRCPTKLAAVDRAISWASQWRQREPWAVQQFMDDIGDSLMFYNLPKDWWKKVRTNNKLERLIRTLRMRLDSMGVHHDDSAVQRAVFGQLIRRHLLGTYTQ